jgi:hypothetical protein
MQVPLPEDWRHEGWHLYGREGRPLKNVLPSTCSMSHLAPGSLLQAYSKRSIILSNASSRNHLKAFTILPHHHRFEVKIALMYLSSNFDDFKFSSLCPQVTNGGKGQKHKGADFVMEGGKRGNLRRHLMRLRAS